MDDVYAFIEAEEHPRCRAPWAAAEGCPVVVFGLLGARAGDGRRNCIGEEFAWTELLIILATVLQRWRLTLASAPPRPQAIVTVQPDKLSMTPQPRKA